VPKGLKAVAAPEERKFVEVEYLLIDVSNLAFRHASVLERFATRDGRRSGHVYGSFKGLKGLVSAYQPRHLVFVYDRGAPWRRMLVPSYKSTRRVGGPGTTAPPPPGVFVVREGQPDDWTPGPDVERLFRAFPGYHLSHPGMEADDMAAWFVKHHPAEKRHGRAIALYTTDKDYWQLVSDEEQVYVLTPRRRPGPRGQARTVNMWVRNEDVETEFHVPPSSVSKVKAIFGDESDNIKRLAGATRPGKLDALREFITSPDAPQYFNAAKRCPALASVPDWVAQELRAQRVEVLQKEAVVNLLGATELVEGNPMVHQVGDTGAALGVLVEFECSSLLSMVVPFFRELQRPRSVMPRMFG